MVFQPSNLMSTKMYVFNFFTLSPLKPSMAGNIHVLKITWRVHGHSRRGLLFPDTHSHTLVFQSASVVFSATFIQSFLMLNGLIILVYQKTDGSFLPHT